MTLFKFLLGKKLTDPRTVDNSLSFFNIIYHWLLEINDNNNDSPDNYPASILIDQVK